MALLSLGPEFVRNDGKRTMGDMGSLGQFPLKWRRAMLTINTGGYFSGANGQGQCSNGSGKFSWNSTGCGNRSMGDIGCLGQYLLNWGWVMLTKNVQALSGGGAHIVDSLMRVVKESGIVLNVGIIR